MWRAARTTRTGLASALSELVDEGAFTNQKLWNWRELLHDNAARPLWRPLKRLATNPMQ